MFKKFGRTPEWIKRLPDSDANKALLLEILRVSAQPIETPKRAIFAISGFKKKEAAVAAVDSYLVNEGWDSQIIYHEATESYFIESEKASYALSKETLMHDEALFGRIANLYGATYDGWTVVLPPKS